MFNFTFPLSKKQQKKIFLYFIQDKKEWGGREGFNVFVSVPEVLVLMPDQSQLRKERLLPCETSKSGGASEGPEPQLSWFCSAFFLAGHHFPLPFPYRQREGVGALPWKESESSPISLNLIVIVALCTNGIRAWAPLRIHTLGAHSLGISALVVATFAGTVGGSDTKAWNFVFRPAGQMLLPLSKPTNRPSRGETAPRHQNYPEVLSPLRHVGRMWVISSPGSRNLHGAKRGGSRGLAGP